MSVRRHKLFALSAFAAHQMLKAVTLCRDLAIIMLCSTTTIKEQRYKVMKRSAAAAVQMTLVYFHFYAISFIKAIA